MDPSCSSPVGEVGTTELTGPLCSSLVGEVGATEPKEGTESTRAQRELWITSGD